MNDVRSDISTEILRSVSHSGFKFIRLVPTKLNETPSQLILTRIYVSIHLKVLKVLCDSVTFKTKSLRAGSGLLIRCSSEPAIHLKSKATNLPYTASGLMETEQPCT